MEPSPIDATHATCRWAGRLPPEEPPIPADAAAHHAYVVPQVREMPPSDRKDIHDPRW
jgi:hypothetical protein